MTARRDVVFPTRSSNICRRNVQAASWKDASFYLLSFWSCLCIIVGYSVWLRCLIHRKKKKKRNSLHTDSNASYFEIWASNAAWQWVRRGKFGHPAFEPRILRWRLSADCLSYDGAPALVCVPAVLTGQSSVQGQSQRIDLRDLQYPVRFIASWIGL